MVAIHPRADEQRQEPHSVDLDEDRDEAPEALRVDALQEDDETSIFYGVPLS